MDFNRVVAGEGSEAYFLRGKDSTPEKLKEPSASLPGHTERTAEFLLPATNKAYSESVQPQFHKLKRSYPCSCQDVSDAEQIPKKNQNHNFAPV